jgi:uncharacterized membrane protein YphA (DoxX/SURF4 family)
MNTQLKHTILLIIRLAVGGMIAWAGIQKLMNTDMMINMFAQMNLSSTIFWLVSAGETLAGLGVLFGVYTQVAAVGTAIIMAGAVYYTKGMIIPVALLIGSLILIYTGSGTYAIKPCTCSVK